MVIQKILNNNVVIALDDKNNEIVATGRGLAFKKKVGDTLADSEVEKKYLLSDRDMTQKFQELLGDVPLEYLELATTIIEEAKVTLETPLNDSIYLSLTDHLYAAIKRTKEAITVRNVLLWDIKRLFPKEFALGKSALAKIQATFEVELAEDEAGFIALHLVNAQSEVAHPNAQGLTELMQKILQITRYFFKVSFDEDSVYFYRFTTHLRFFAERIITGTQLSDEIDTELLLIIRKKYPNAFACVEKIQQFIQQKYQYAMTNDEKLYLTIHIARLIQKTKT